MYKLSQNQNLIEVELADLAIDKATSTINLTGVWMWATINEKILLDKIKQLANQDKWILDGLQIKDLDTCGILFIQKIIDKLKQAKTIELILSANDQQLFDDIDAVVKNRCEVESIKKENNFFANLGEQIFNLYDEFIQLSNFLGGVIVNWLIALKQPLGIDYKEISRTVYNCAVNGVWVAALLSFLIGITLAYEISPQFITYGANVYIVNFLGISLLKEVSPLLTAVIVAGRTGASITAEMGTMKIQEEIDAIQTMGISPIQRLVIPKIIGVVIALPLVTSLCDIVGMVGGAIIADSSLNVNYSLFLSRLQQYVSVHNYTDGLIKSIAFGFIIAFVGCKQGLNVAGNANSIGEQTTKSVVMSIILIVIVDAIFATIFKALGI